MDPVLSALSELSLDDPTPEQAEVALKFLASAFESESNRTHPPSSELFLRQEPATRIPVRMAEARYRTLIEQIPVVTFMAMLDGGLFEAYVSPQIESMLGYSQKEWLENPVLWYRRLHPDDKPRWNAEFARVVTTGEPFASVYRFLAKDGHTVWIRGEGRIVRDEDGVPLFIQGVGFDVSEIKQAELRLEESLTEKETLLKEIHHRVKNNLQITAGLFSLQAATIADAHVQEVFRESENRIKSMALVHEMLYQSRNLAHIEISDYVESLAQTLLRSYSLNEALIDPQFDLQKVSLDIDRAIPFGLIVNELVGNCVKHGFAAGAKGSMWVTLRMDRDIVFTVADNGRGIPKGYDFRKAKTLGMQLVLTLTKQLKGNIELKTDGRTEFRVSFPK